MKNKNKKFKTIYNNNQFVVSKNKSGIKVFREGKNEFFKYGTYSRFPNWNNYFDVCIWSWKLGQFGV